MSWIINVFLLPSCYVILVIYHSDPFEICLSQHRSQLDPPPVPALLHALVLCVALLEEHMGFILPSSSQIMALPLLAAHKQLFSVWHEYYTEQVVVSTAASSRTFGEHQGVWGRVALWVWIPLSALPGTLTIDTSPHEQAVELFWWFGVSRTAWRMVFSPAACHIPGNSGPLCRAGNREGMSLHKKLCRVLAVSSAGL